MKTALKKAFTLMEVNLAIFVMAVGVLSMVSLYELGFRERDQSEEDVVASAYCDSIMNALVANLSATNLSWKSWRQLDGQRYPSGGWKDYFKDNYYAQAKGMSQINGLGQQAFNAAASAVGTPDFGRITPDFPNASKLAVALVVKFEGTRCTISARGTARPAMLLAQPIYYTEVNFQGDLTK